MIAFASAGGRLAGSVSAVLAVVALALPASAGAKGDPDPLSLGPISPNGAAGPVRDTVLDGGELERLRARSAAAAEVYPDADGHSVSVEVSRSYANRGAVARGLVAFLGTLLHGDEMDQLSVMLATPGEIRRACGPDALACYSPTTERMVVSGQDARPGEPPRELVIAHEYGHHVAANRSNRPWSALDRGTKRWSTHEGICRGIERRRIDPFEYLENPGEAFAEAFAFYHFPDVIRWGWKIARPDAGAFDAIRADVELPWTRGTRVEWSGVLDRDDPRDVRRVRTPLDGTLKVKLRGPRGADFDLAVLGAKRKRRVLKRADTRGRRETLRFTLCGKRTVRIAVSRDRGRGKFEVTAARP